ncbi:MAG: hypothetical protein AAF696_06475 [Bacteroidota bacterium]
MKLLRKTLTSLLWLFPLALFAQENQHILEELKYRNIGPTRGGRVTSVTGVESQQNTFYMGATGGGVWKSTNYGYSWKNISDGAFHTGSIGALRVAKSNPKVIYVGTGSDGIRSNVITGKGVYKSTDAGKSWSHIGLEKTGHIGAVEIDPSSPDRVFVAAIGQAFQPNPERGVYRTTDGGKNWEKVFYHSDTVGVVDLEFAPDNSNMIYASLWQVERKPWTIRSGGSIGGIYKSTDGGDNWVKVGNGLPTELVGKIDMAVSPANPNILWALVEAPQGKGGVFKSTDRGENFELVSTKKELLDRPFYYCNIDVNPLNPNSLYVNSTQFWYSGNGGKSWRRIRTPHGDNHDIWINPNDTLLSVQGNDGGANVSRDNMRTWSSINNQSTAELYQVEVDDQQPYWLYAGQQDNSTIAVPSLPPYNSISGPSNYWKAVGGCETGPAVPKPGNPDIIYSNCKGRFGVYNKKTGQEMQYYVGAANMYGQNPRDLKFRFQRVSPIHVSPHNPDVVYHTSQFVHKTTDDGKTWEIISPDLTAFEADKQVLSGSPITRDITGEEFYSTIYAIRESPLTEGLIWVGANDGPVHVTKDGGQNWKKVTPKKLGKGGRVDCVEPSPHNPAKAYVTVLRYMLGDWQPYIYKTENYGKSWKRISDGENGIPADYPVRVVREDPDREGLLYAGTEFGMFISMDDGKSWKKFQQNLPVTPITDMKVYRKDLILSTMGRGFWIIDDLSPLHLMDEELMEMTIFAPRKSIRMAYRGSSKNAIPYYPSPGIYIDYYLADTTKDLRIDISNAQGEIIQSFTPPKPKAKKDSAKKEGVSMATGFGPVGSLTNLKTTPGHHRIRWDMRHPGPWHKSSSRRGRGGPKLLPGTYVLTIKSDQAMVSTDLRILIDPRIEAAGISMDDLTAQEELSLKIRDLLSEAREMEYELGKEEKALKKKIKEEKEVEASQKALDQVKEVKNELSTAKGRYQIPQIVDQVSYLYSMLLRADQAPGKDAFDRYEELKAKFEDLKEKEWPRSVEGED